MFIYNYYTNKNIEEKENKSIEIYFERVKDEVPNKITTKESSEDFTSYIAVLEIPKINLKRGLVDPSSPENNVSQNIEIIKPVEMPDKENGTFILASHSGSSRVAFFDRIDELEKDDNIYVYYKNQKYIYKVTDYYKQNKNGTIKIRKNKNDRVVVLTTCSHSNKEQLIYVATLENKKNYEGVD